MNRRAFITCFTATITLSAAKAFSASVEDGVIAQLTKQGFSSISSETTWLGRVRIRAKRKDGSREIVMNPRTGEILRDQFTALNSAEGTKPILDDIGDSSGSSGSDDGSSSGGGSDDGGSGQGDSGSGSDDGGSDGSGSSGSGSGSTGSGGGKGGDDKEDDKNDDGGDDRAKTTDAGRRGA